MTEPRGRGYEWSSIGGHLALDLCNTASWRLDPARRIERLAGPGDLADWFCALTDPAGSADSADAGQLKRRFAESAEAGRRALSQVRELRDALTRVLDAQLGFTAQPVQPDDVALIAGAWRAALAVAGTEPELPWRWTLAPSDPEGVVHALALAVGELVHGRELSGLRRCEGESCGWLFLDTTRNHSRRWCDPLDCGNRARVRKYAQRRKVDRLASADPGDRRRC